MLVAFLFVSQVMAGEACEESRHLPYFSDYNPPPTPGQLKAVMWQQIVACTQDLAAGSLDWRAKLADYKLLLQDWQQYGELDVPKANFLAYEINGITREIESALDGYALALLHGQDVNEDEVALHIAELREERDRAVKRHDRMVKHEQ